MIQGSESCGQVASYQTTIVSHSQWSLQHSKDMCWTLGNNDTWRNFHVQPQRLEANPNYRFRVINTSRTPNLENMGSNMESWLPEKHMELISTLDASHIQLNALIPGSLIHPVRATSALFVTSLKNDTKVEKYCGLSTWYKQRHSRHTRLRPTCRVERPNQTTIGEQFTTTMAHGASKSRRPIPSPHQARSYILRPSRVWFDNTSTLHWYQPMTYPTASRLCRSIWTMTAQNLIPPFCWTLYVLINSIFRHIMALRQTLTAVLRGKVKSSGNTFMRLAAYRSSPTSRASQRSDWKGARYKLGRTNSCNLTATNYTESCCGKDWSACAPQEFCFHWHHMVTKSTRKRAHWRCQSKRLRISDKKGPRKDASIINIPGNREAQHFFTIKPQNV